MGCAFGFSSTHTNYNSKNPNPKRWELVSRYDAPHAHALKIKYPGCTNFEGIKILVYQGKFEGLKDRDPHFFDKSNLLARFRPDQWELACDFVDMLEEEATNE